MIVPKNVRLGYIAESRGLLALGASNAPCVISRLAPSHTAPCSASCQLSRRASGGFCGMPRNYMPRSKRANCLRTSCCTPLYGLRRDRRPYLRRVQTMNPLLPHPRIARTAAAVSDRVLRLLWLLRDVHRSLPVHAGQEVAHRRFRISDVPAPARR
jgi:hypothetical protein